MTRPGAGVAGMSLTLRILIAVVWTAGLVVAGAALATAGHAPQAFRYLAAVGLFAVTQLTRTQIRVGSEHVMLAWGEIALVIGMCLLPWHWMIPAVLLGVLVGGLISGLDTVKAFFNAAACTLSASVAVAVAGLVGTVSAVPPLTPRSISALVTAAAVYWLVTALFVMPAVTLAHGGCLRTVMLRSLGTKLLILIGNIVLGLLAVGLGLADFRYLAFAPPLLWLLYETYQARMKAGEERRAWQELATALHALSKLDVPAVAESAVTGALRLFSPDAVELTVHRPERPDLHYRGRPGLPLASSAGDKAEPARDWVISRGGASDARTGTDPETLDGDLPPVVQTRRLTLGTESVGEFRLRFRRQVSFGARDQLAFSAFADALAAALHNAASHSQLLEMAERKAYEADHDLLTGLANRTRLLEYGEDLLRPDPGTAVRQVALLLLDLQHFSDVNDTLGHSAGDQLLRATARTLGRHAHGADLLARLGGDEFALLIGGLPDTSEACEHAERRAGELAAALTAPVEIAGVVLSVEASIGVVTAPVGGCVMAELLRRADVAVSQAKRTGRSMVRYEAGRDAASTDRLALLAEFREALAADDQLILQLQPAVDLASGGPTGVEALARWRHPRRGMLGPGDFVPAIEQSDLVGPFTRYVLNVALGVMARWHAEGLDVPIAVNMSARSLLDRRLPADVAELLDKHRMPPDKLVLEITETAMMTELEVIDDVLAGLRDIGVQLSVDDFGTGYSSLTFLARVAVDEVKVDQEFVARMGDSPEAAAIVRSTVELGRALGLRVIAEGVETADQKAALAAMGCEAAQGYHFFPPLDEDKAGPELWKLRRAAEARGARVIPLTGRAAHTD